MEEIKDQKLIAFHRLKDVVLEKKNEYHIKHMRKSPDYIVIDQYNFQLLKEFLIEAGPPGISVDTLILFGMKIVVDMDAEPETIRFGQKNNK